jgi:hypothetical protein
MKRFQWFLALVVVSGMPLVACGGDSGDDDDDEGGNGSGDPVASCKKLSATICRKFYNCFTEEELTAAAEVVGNNEADCNTKFNVDCNPDAVKCDSGETYNASMANECVSSFEDFSCDEVRGFGDGTTQAPAACSQVCQ